MTSDHPQPSVASVLLNLAHDDDYTVLVQALEEYEGVMQNEADDERVRMQFNGNPEIASQESHYQSLADRARLMRLDIEQQVEACDP
ncbi:hypothetical protein [Leucobacter sp. NPDC077196]|uniref:hypothetical protein n=1 Tax=Leucobacter sp. NPDC077196 TaxID=3154959 RepID=UPI003448E62C